MDQITANIYTVGDGIPPHVDNPYAFGSNIISLSLLSDVLLEFKRGDNVYPLDLARKSLLIMTGEARYSWFGLKFVLNPKISVTIFGPKKLKILRREKSEMRFWLTKITK